MPEPASATPLSARLEWMAPEHRGWVWLLALGTVATVVPLWTVPHLPFSDLPEHAAQIAILRHWWDSDWRLQARYTLDLGHTQYLLYYVAGALVSWVVGSAERANLLLLSAVAVATPWSLRSLFRAVGADPRGALVALPLFWNQSLLFGLVNYLAALPVCFYALALLARDAQAPRPSRQVWLALLAGVLFYLHLSALLFFLPAAALLSWLWPRPEALGPRALLARLPSVARRSAWLVPVVALCLFWMVTSPVLRPEAVGFKTDMKAQFFPLLEAVQRLPHALTDIWKSPTDRYLLNALLITLGVLAFPTRRCARAEMSAGWGRAVLGLIFAFTLALYLFMPHSYGWLWLLNDRYAVVAAMLAPGLAMPRASPRAALCFGSVFIIGLFAAVDSGRLIQRCAEESAGIDEVLQAARPGQKLLALYFSDESEWIRYNPYHHYHALYRARTGGVAEHSFLELPQSPVRYLAGQQPPSRPYGWEWEPTRFRNAEHGGYFDYLLLRGPGEVAAAEGPHWSEVARSGQWRLLARQPALPHASSAAR